MKCGEIQKLLPDYGTGDLSERERELVAKHLADCPDCAAELAAWREYRSKLGLLREDTAPPGFLSRVRGRIEAESRITSPLKRLFTPIRLKLPLEAAAAAAVVIMVVYILNITPETGTLSRAVRPTASQQRADRVRAPEIAKDGEAVFSRKERKVTTGRAAELAALPLREEIADEETAPMSRSATGGGEGPVELVLLVAARSQPAPGAMGAGAPLLRMKAVEEKKLEIEEADTIEAQSPPPTA